ncbi:MAG TPA: toll/interleukin-1 receptor domain-containing protein, partial [Ktedonobacterales bacterium]
WLRDRIIAGEPTADAAARLLAAQPAQPATSAPAMESTASAAGAEPPGALIYIACARADLARVEPAVTALRERGFNVHFDATSAHGSGGYVHESQQALRQADAFVVFVSRAATQSAWVEAETRAFQASMARDANRKLIPVRLDDSSLPLSLAHYSAIDGAAATATPLADAIAGALDGAPAQTGAAASEAPMRGAPASGATSPAEEAEEAEEAERGAAADVSEPDTAAAADNQASAPEPAPPPVTPQPITQPGGASHTTGAPAPQPAPAVPDGAFAGASAGEAAAPQSSSQEQVTFTAYHPREIPPQQWQPLVIYLSLDNAATMALVAAAAAERLAGRRDQFRPGRSSHATGLKRGTALRIIPTMPGFEFNPGYLDVTWQEDVQQHEFRMRATSAQPGQAANGVVQFFQGMLLRGEVPISAFVGQSAARLDSPDAYAQAIARAYRRIFASYSHQDMPVVESCESAARTMGDQYLRDVSLLQSGQQWDPRLIQAINDADIFQLFWSKRAATSPFVAREWQHALMLLPARPNFIRPVYWTRQLYPTPTELNALHFQPLSLSSLGWGRLRAAWYEMRNR